MKLIAPVTAGLLLLTGCNTTKDAARSKILIDVDKLARTGKLEIQSPKDVDLRNIRVVKKGEDYEVSIGQYQAVVSMVAVESAKAEIEANRTTITEVIAAFKFLAEKAAASQGVPQTAPVAPAPAPATKAPMPTMPFQSVPFTPPEGGIMNAPNFPPGMLYGTPPTQSQPYWNGPQQGFTWTNGTLVITNFLITPAL